MSFRLMVLSWWTPRYVIRRELDRVSELTTAALISLVEAHALDSPAEPADLVRPTMSIEARRAAMAKRHAALVEALVSVVGRDKAVELGRNALFLVGQNLGKEAREKLGIGNEFRDLIRAARIMYRVLGIQFRIEGLGDGKASMVVERCALSKEYSELTCLVLSATDEGVVRGLDPRACMKFTERMTSGGPTCVASIEFTVEEAGR